MSDLVRFMDEAFDKDYENEDSKAKETNVDWKQIATDSNQTLLKANEMIDLLLKDSNLRKGSLTPAPVSDEHYRYSTENIQLPRFAYGINFNWFYYMRMDSVTLRTVVLKLKQEILRVL